MLAKPAKYHLGLEQLRTLTDVGVVVFQYRHPCPDPPGGRAFVYAALEVKNSLGKVLPGESTRTIRDYLEGAGTLALVERALLAAVAPGRPMVTTELWEIAKRAVLYQAAHLGCLFVPPRPPAPDRPLFGRLAGAMTTCESLARRQDQLELAGLKHVLAGEIETFGRNMRVPEEDLPRLALAAVADLLRRTGGDARAAALLARAAAVMREAGAG